MCSDRSTESELEIMTGKFHFQYCNRQRKEVTNKSNKVTKKSNKVTNIERKVTKKTKELR